MAKTYKVMKFVFEKTIDNAFVNRKYIQVEGDLSWEDAKALRKSLGGDVNIVEQK